ncbi:hypothetical protein NPIL_316221 [Nephila pilipes]|uniref:K Homology domain-containing protein n=1 Tax=Nephila pilipes TaxID=299642 RepID=A0A8X6NF29_NEPPI|nr:hypothetical protein NPIL_316221 [Nephila pilipes]
MYNLLARNRKLQVEFYVYFATLRRWSKTAEVFADSDTEDQNPPNSGETKNKNDSSMKCEVEDLEAMGTVECIISQEHYRNVLGTRGSKCRLQYQPSSGWPIYGVLDRRSRPISASSRRLCKEMSESVIC